MKYCTDIHGHYFPSFSLHPPITIPTPPANVLGRCESSGISQYLHRDGVWRGVVRDVSELLHPARVSLGGTHNASGFAKRLR
ncbi:hypothetical protein E2C01_052299 [Portunus trituberculatus]|uniref:Uncharacterized protein n=1 Tax=Portunus trituberculatus TaxID=210409 RepID=A0A5B7GLH5_PORTR|nr:hypothetical protein [Portunus trituberculatus]